MDRAFVGQTDARRKRNAADYADEWLTTENGHEFRARYVCVAGAFDPTLHHDLVHSLGTPTRRPRGRKPSLFLSLSSKVINRMRRASGSYH